MKRFTLLFLALIFSTVIMAQNEVSGVSESKYVSISKDPPKPPYLEIEEGSLKFIDGDGNNFINANEAAYIEFSLKNTGIGTGLGLELFTAEKNNVIGLLYNKRTELGNLEPNQSKYIKVPIKANISIPESKANFALQVKELNGFGTDPVYLEVETRAFIPPHIKIMEHKVTSQQGSTIQKRKAFDVQILLQNTGQGNAEDISVLLSVPENILPLSDNMQTNIPKVASGEQVLLEYTLIANNNYSHNSIDLNFSLSESYQKYAENKTISLTMDQAVSYSKLVVEGKDDNIKPVKLGSLSSVVDKNIPVNQAKNPNRLALIIGNEDYSGNLNAEINVNYARNDAEIFKRYANSVLGVEEINTFSLIDATAGEMRKEIDKVASLLSRMGPGSELIFYYAGHGLPDEATKTPYLIPIDVDATNLTAAIKLSDIYDKFGNSGAKRITVFLDACFSGGGRNQGLLAARGARIKPKEELVPGNMIVFSATREDQSALPYEEQQHGMFTFFLLKKIQESNGQVNYKELSDYLKRMVSIESVRVNGKEQDPVVRTSYSVENEWGTWNF